MGLKKPKVLQIRQAQKSEIYDLVNLDDKCFDTYYYENTKFSKLEFQDYFLCKKSMLLVAIRGVHIRGYVAGRVRTSQGQLIAHLDSIAVSPTVQHKGIGSQLLHQFIQEAKQHTCKMVMLEVAQANKAGLRFFAKHGFLKIHDLPGYYGSDLDGVLMKLSF
jgi:ribosomal protein S18 acetylase RimI-like enzyme